MWSYLDSVRSMVLGLLCRPGGARVARFRLQLSSLG
jgi:hypothetical protein